MLWFRAVVAACLFLASLSNAHLDRTNLTCDDTSGRLCGNGFCPIPNGECTCDALWSTKADFVLTPGDCGTSFIGIYVLWSINLLVIFWYFYTSLWVIVIRVEVFLETRRTRKNYGLKDNKALVGILLYLTFSIPFHIIMAIANLVDPTTRVGFDVLPSICFFFGKVGLYLSIAVVQGSMLSVALKSQKSQRKLVLANYVWQFTVNFISILLGTFQFLTLMYFQENVPVQFDIMQAYYLIQSGALFCAGMAPIVIIIKVNSALKGGKDLLDSNANNKTEEIRKKVNALQKTAVTQGFLQGFLYLIMGTVPFFINKHKYFLAISWLAMPLIHKKLAHQFIADPGSRTIMQRLGIKKTDSQAPTNPLSSSKHGNNNDSQMMSRPTVNTRQVANTGGGGSMTEFETQNPVFSESVLLVKKGFRKKSKNMTTNNHSSFFSSDGALLEDLLTTEHPLHEKFVKFVKSRHAENEVAFLEATLKYKLCTDAKERKKVGVKIVNEFVVNGSARQVDMPQEQKEILESTAKRSQFVNTTFDEIRKTLKFDLKGNFLAGFEKQLDKEQVQLQKQMQEDLKL